MKNNTYHFISKMCAEQSDKTMLMDTYKANAAEVVTEVQGGGQIQNSKLGQGLLNMVRDITGTMQWILPIVRSLFHFVLCI